MTKGMELCWICTRCQWMLRQCELDFFQIAEPVVCGKCSGLIQRHSTPTKRRAWEPNPGFQIPKKRGERSEPRFFWRA